MAPARGRCDAAFPATPDDKPSTLTAILTDGHTMVAVCSGKELRFSPIKFSAIKTGCLELPLPDASAS